MDGGSTGGLDDAGLGLLERHRGITPALLLLLALGATSCHRAGAGAAASEPIAAARAVEADPDGPAAGALPTAPATVALSDEAWRERLTPEQYRVLRDKGTERAFSGALWDEKRDGVYRCAGCGAPLFAADTKFDSGTGWPSFWAPADPRRIATEDDWGLFQRRTEVLCAACGGHLGHVFEDGPRPTGLRYCINSAAMTFDAAPAADAPAEPPSGPDTQR